METPSFDHISQFPSVYEPSEDTFLFLDAIEEEKSFLQELNPKIIVEIGSGSGVNITAVGKIIKNSFLIATDINEEACRATEETALRNNVEINVCNMNLLDNFREGIIDLIIFNPPYVVTDSSEIRGYGIERSWAGGFQGREVMDKLFPRLNCLLSEKGVCYLVAIKENDPNDIMNFMTDFNFKCNIIKDRKILGEHLYILKFQKIGSLNSSFAHNYS